MTVNVKGKSLVDVRIDGYEPKNYIDYTDNDSPWFVAAGDFDGNRSWNQVNPKYEGWSVPTKKQLMLAWVYNSNRIYGTNFYWMNELSHDVNSRWNINMGLGEVLPYVSDQTFQLLAVKEYNGSGKYPYLEGDNGNFVRCVRDVQ